MTSPTTDRRFGLVGNTAVKAPVTVVATGNITLSGQQTIDGVAVLAINSAGVPDRVLCIGQTNPVDNGIWDVSTASWTRSLDANGNYDLTQGTIVQVYAGSTGNAGAFWSLITSGAITVGTTALSWARSFASSVATQSIALNSIAALRTQPKTGSPRALVAGYYAAGDGGGGQYYYDSTDIASADNGGSIIVATDGGRWKLAQPFPVSVKQFGAKGDGATNDTAAITAALATGKSIVIPAGDYHTTGGHAISVSGQTFIGLDPDAVTFTMTNAATAFLTVAAGLSNVRVSGFTLDRSITATAGGDGIACSGDTEGALFCDLTITKQYRGLVLGSTNQGVVRNVTVNKCQSHGVVMANNASVSQLQWFLEMVGVGTCGGNGFFVDGALGTAVAFLDTWHNCFTFANSGRGILMLGSTLSPIGDARITDGFFGADGNGLITIASTGVVVGGDHLISNCFFESAGTGPTGPTLATVASNVGSAISFDASCTRATVSNCRIGTCSEYGITSAAGSIVITGNKIHDNNSAGGVANSGVQILAGKATITGNRIGNSIAANQKYGVSCAADNAHVIVGNDLSNNATAPLFFPSTFTSSLVMGNMPASAQAQSWTPTVAFGAASVGITYTTRLGTFVKHGSFVTASFLIVLSSKGSSTGSVTIGGLPVACAANTAGAVSVSFCGAMATLSGGLNGNLAAGASAASVSQIGAAGSVNLLDTNFTNTSQIQGLITYISA